MPIYPLHGLLNTFYVLQLYLYSIKRHSKTYLLYLRLPGNYIVDFNMKVALIASSFLAVCLAAPAAVSSAKPVGLVPTDCFCSYPICPMELIAVC